jgi:hypothetical protein
MPEAEDLLLPVPELVGATYLVPTNRPPIDPTDTIAGRRWPDPLRRGVRSLLDRGVVAVRPINLLPPLPLSLFAAAGATAVQVGRIRAATHAVVVAIGAPPGWPPLTDWAARAVAAAVAAELGADVVDLMHHQVLTPERATQSLPDEAEALRLADWICVAYSADSSGYWVTTSGLRRFGLPELQSLATPPNSVEQWGQAMTAIGAVLLGRWVVALERHRGAAFITLPAGVGIGRDDLAAAYQRAPLSSARGGPARVRLGLEPANDPDSHAFLTVHPPLDWPGSAGEHVADVCALLFGPRTSEIRQARRGELMDQAIASARAGLTGIRRRFESGALDLRTKLLVKYALPAEAGTEYLWAYVTSWRDPYRILATSAADAVYHPKIRTGRPVVVDTSAVVDWAVEHDQRGIVEGYWTKIAVEDA